MGALPAFRLIRPATVAEAVAARIEDPRRRFVAGGTDLLVNMRRGIVDAPALIELAGIEALGRIVADPDGGYCIGAGVTIAALAGHAALAARFPAIASAADAIAGPTHRYVATVGGNLCLDTRCVFYNQSEWWRAANDYCLKDRGDTCHVAPQGDRCLATYSGDLAPALIALDAEARIAGPDGERRIALDEMYRDDGRDHLRLDGGEILTEIRVPPPPAGLRCGYEKIRVRGALDFPLAGVAVALARDGAGLGHLRVALTGTNCHPLRVRGTDALLGAPLDDGAAERLAKLLPRQIRTVRTTFSPAHYRRRAAVNVTRRLARRLYLAA